MNLVRPRPDVLGFADQIKEEVKIFGRAPFNKTSLTNNFLNKLRYVFFKGLVASTQQCRGILQYLICKILYLITIGGRKTNISSHMHILLILKTHRKYLKGL